MTDLLCCPPARACFRLFVPVALATVSACELSYPPPPRTAQIPVVDTLHGVEFTDPYRWLEDQQSTQTRAWIDEQNAYAQQVVGETPLRTGLERRLTELMDVQRAVFPRRSGDYEYFLLRRPGKEVAKIYRRPAPARPENGPMDTSGEFEIVIDPLDFNPDGTVSVSILDLSLDGRLMLYAVRDGGRDERQIRIRDLITGEDLPDRLNEALYGSVFFSPDRQRVYYSRRSRTSGARVRRHTIGTAVRDDAELFGEGHGPDRFVSVFLGGEARYLVYTVQHGWAKTEVYLQDLWSPGPLIVIVNDADARFEPRFVDGELFLLTNLDAPKNRLLAADPRNPGPENWREVLPEGADLLTGYQVLDGHIYANYLHNVSSRIVRYSMDGTSADTIRTPDHHVAALRGWRDGTALLTVTSLVTPSRILTLDLENTRDRRVAAVPSALCELRL